MTARCSATRRVMRRRPILRRSSIGPIIPGPLGGMLGAVEMCNNNGTCRAFDAGVMCPSYRVTRDETHLTRGRANTLRLALTGQLGADAMASDAVADAMKLCVSCKACRRECPTGVDMAKMKIEVLAARGEHEGVTWRDSLIAELPRFAPLVARIAPLANLRNRIPALRRLGERRLGLAAARPLPAWRRDAFRNSEADAFAPAKPRGEVLLLADTFNRWFEPENLRAALRVLPLPAIAPCCRTPRAGRCAAAALILPPGWSTRHARKRGARCGARTARCR